MVQTYEQETTKTLTKQELAKQLGVSRASLYYVPKRPALDEEVKGQIESVLTQHPAYGHKRIALSLKLNKKRIRRVMKKFGIKPYRRRNGGPTKPDDVGKPKATYANHIKGLCPIAPNVVWVSDFTYIKYQGRFIYVATIMDLYTREIVGWCIGRFHTQELVLGAFEHAIERTGTVPVYLHSDQGSEYQAAIYTSIAEELGVIISMSKKASPWENGYQESFYGKFKVDLGDVSRFGDLGELIATLHEQVQYYNTQRIHTTLKMAPQQFRKLWDDKHVRQSV